MFSLNLRCGLARYSPQNPTMTGEHAISAARTTASNDSRFHASKYPTAYEFSWACRSRSTHRIDDIKRTLSFCLDELLYHQRTRRGDDAICRWDDKLLHDG